jgi:hypothetical protein
MSFIMARVLAQKWATESAIFLGFLLACIKRDKSAVATI